MTNRERAAIMTTASIANCPVTLQHDNPGMEVTLTPRQGEAPGIDYIDVALTATEPTRPNSIMLTWDYKSIDVHQRTCTEQRPNLGGCGRARTRSSAARGAPVWCMYNYAGDNRTTIAVADAINTCEISAAHQEETAILICSIELLIDPVPPLTEYTTTIRIDTREQKYWQAMQDVSDWWAAMPEYTPAPVPETARLPFYSTWYSYHLGITPDAIEKECRLAKALGMEAVIVDDGWQTDDMNRGYSYCGDWEAAASKFPDFREHVDRVHAIGMKYLLWFSVPFMGVNAKHYDRFKDKCLTRPENNPNQKWFTLDPRFPEVREYLIGVYERCINEFDLDGFKLDFIDCFGTNEETKDAFGDGRDYQSVPEAADRLMSDVITRLKAIKPDVMIEFRQGYIGPAMRKYGNIFRVGDEPNNAGGNRIGSMLLRALSGTTAVHSDMVMWHYEDTVESAAQQLIHALFTVPQISVRLDEVPASHVDMIRRYCAFWREHRDVLLDGTIAPLQPQFAYPVVISETESKVAAAAYANGFVPLPPVAGRTLILVNGTLEPRVVIELPDPLGARRVQIWNCTGACVSDEEQELAAGLHAIAVPAAGTAVIG
ncbi:MAG: alpha-galactosidase [Verrucomicrobia bacterium]|jgi:alpha-galactosidase|nr:alpha-galactosidase [Verrucomicrobiota bacterium]